MARIWWLYPLVGAVVWMLTTPALPAIDWPGLAAAAQAAGLPRTAAALEETAPSYAELAATLGPIWPLVLGGCVGVVAARVHHVTRARPAPR